MLLEAESSLGKSSKKWELAWLQKMLLLAEMLTAAITAMLLWVTSSQTEH